MMIKRALSLAVLVCLSVAACGADPAPAPNATPTPSATPTPVVEAEPAEVLQNIEYVDDADARHTLDLYLPANSGEAPLVVFVHGGGWLSGSKDLLADSGEVGLEHLRDALAGSGYAVAAVNYRLTGQSQFPAQIHDVNAAVRYLRANAASLGVDPDRFAIIGDSAGGHLAMLAGLAPELAGDLGVTGVSSDVSAVVTYYGVADLARMVSDREDQDCGPGEAGPSSPEGKLIGADPADPAAAQTAANASPISYIDSGDPPVLLFHGNWDCVVPASQSQRMHEALQEAGVTTQLVRIDTGHAKPEFFATPALQERLISFLDTHVKQ